MPAYVTEYANPSKQSRVDVPASTYSRLDRVADTRAEAGVPAPSFVYVAADGRHALVRYEGLGGDVVTPDGRVVSTGAGTNTANGPSHESILVSAAGYASGPDFFGWSGQHEYVLNSGNAAAGTELAQRLVDGLYTNVTQAEPARSGEQQVGAEGVIVHEVARRSESGSKLQWQGWLDGRGVGAIAADGRVVVVMSDGRFRVYAAEGEAGSSDARVLAEGTIAGEPYAVSVGDDGFFVLAKEISGPSGPAWSVRALDMEGRERWHTTVPFAGLQPPIAGGGGRVYVAGKGLAALEGGKLTWSVASPSAVRATAFADGTLALAVGASVRIVANDGRVKQEFRTAEGEEVTTPPAIGPDAAVWVASARHVYVLR
jgi:hypothetical protein